MSLARLSPISGKAASESTSAVFGSMRSASSFARAGTSGCGLETCMGFSAYRIPAYSASARTSAMSTPRCALVHGCVSPGMRSRHPIAVISALLCGEGVSPSSVAANARARRPRHVMPVSSLFLAGELLAHFLDLRPARLGHEHVVHQPAAGDGGRDVGEVAPGDAFDVRLAQRHLVD